MVVGILCGYSTSMSSDGMNSGVVSGAVVVDIGGFSGGVGEVVIVVGGVGVEWCTGALKDPRRPRWLRLLCLGDTTICAVVGVQMWVRVVGAQWLC